MYHFIGDIFMNEENLIKYYNKFNEDKRLNTRHGQVEFITSMKYIKEYLKEFNNPKYLFIALLFSILCAFFDEFHQLFVDGRSGQIKDVLIDSMGAFVTLLILRNIRVISK